MKNKKFAFPYQQIIDEWNPHIVRYVRTEAPELKGDNFENLRRLKDLSEEQKNSLGVDRLDFLENNFKEWFTKWNSAQSILNKKEKRGIYPLAYCLEPTLSDVIDVDPIEDSKFGGVPDFRHRYQFRDSEGKNLQELISKLWPRCGECGKHMEFLAGVDLSDWLVSIHLLTNNTFTHTSYGSKVTEADVAYYQHSGLGFSKNLCVDSFPFSKQFYQIFYCSESHSNSMNFDAMLYTEHRCNGKGEIFDIEEYRKSISEFVSNNKIESKTPIQTMTGLTLKFDIDIPGEEFIEDWMTELIEKHPKIFGRDEKYRFFGHPYSQQTETRPVCQNAYHLGLHRMAPIINWTNQKEDQSYQIYGCLKCQHHLKEEIYCKKDVAGT